MESFPDALANNEHIFIILHQIYIPEEIEVATHFLHSIQGSLRVKDEVVAALQSAHRERRSERGRLESSLLRTGRYASWTSLRVLLSKPQDVLRHWDWEHVLACGEALRNLGEDPTQAAFEALAEAVRHLRGMLEYMPDHLARSWLAVRKVADSAETWGVYGTMSENVKKNVQSIGTPTPAALAAAVGAPGLGAGAMALLICEGGQIQKWWQDACEKPLTELIDKLNTCDGDSLRSQALSGTALADMPFVYHTPRELMKFALYDTGPKAKKRTRKRPAAVSVPAVSVPRARKCALKPYFDYGESKVEAELEKLNEQLKQSGSGHYVYGMALHMQYWFQTKEAYLGSKA